MNTAHHFQSVHNENINPDCEVYNNNDSGQGASSSDASTSSKTAKNPFYKRN